MALGDSSGAACEGDAAPRHDLRALVGGATPAEHPLFVRPERYRSRRTGRGLPGFLKRFGERRALRRCRAALPGVRSVVDVPCGYGALFEEWTRNRWEATGLDLSRPMVEAARGARAAREGTVRVLQGDAFALERSLGAPVDLLVCVRFLYYYSRPRRIALLRHFARWSDFQLLELRSSESLRARRMARRDEPGERARRRHTRAQARSELEAAGLRCLRMEPPGPFSERLFVLSRSSERAQTAASSCALPRRWRSARTPSPARSSARTRPGSA